MSDQLSAYARITRERLQAWGDRLATVQATPLLLIGVAHGAAKGELHVCIPEGVPHETALLAGALRYVLAELERGGLEASP